MNVKVLERLAREGVPEAQYVLAFLKENGLGYPVNLSEAQEWYHKSADRRFAAAHFEIFMLEQTKGFAALEKATKQEHKQAMEVSLRKAADDWLRKAADGGFAPAQLGACHAMEFSGLLRYNQTDLQEPYRYALAAAEQGYASAMHEIAQMYLDGRCGLEASPTTAFVWFKKAAESGHALSAPRVAEMLESGNGVEKDDAAALQWRLKAFEMKAPGSAMDLSRIYRYGLLGQPVDKRKADAYAAQGQEFLKQNLESLGLTTAKERETLLQKLAGG